MGTCRLIGYAGFQTPLQSSDYEGIEPTQIRYGLKIFHQVLSNPKSETLISFYLVSHQSTFVHFQDQILTLQYKKGLPLSQTGLGFQTLSGTHIPKHESSTTPSFTTGIDVGRPLFIDALVPRNPTPPHSGKTWDMGDIFLIQFSSVVRSLGSCSSLIIIML